MTGTLSHAWVLKFFFTFDQLAVQHRNKQSSSLGGRRHVRILKVLYESTRRCARAPIAEATDLVGSRRRCRGRSRGCSLGAVESKWTCCARCTLVRDSGNGQYRVAPRRADLP